MWDALPDQLVATIAHCAFDEDNYDHMAHCCRRTRQILANLDHHTQLFAPLLHTEEPGLKEALDSATPLLGTGRLFSHVVLWFRGNGEARWTLRAVRVARRRWANFQLKYAPLWAADELLGILLREAICRLFRGYHSTDGSDFASLINDYQHFIRLVTHDGRILSRKALTPWHVLLETLCDSVSFPLNRAAVTFLLDTVSQIDSFRAYRVLLGQFRHELTPTQIKVLTDEANMTFDLARGCPYH